MGRLDHLNRNIQSLKIPLVRMVLLVRLCISQLLRIPEIAGIKASRKKDRSKNPARELERSSAAATAFFSPSANRSGPQPEMMRALAVPMAESCVGLKVDICHIRCASSLTSYGSKLKPFTSDCTKSRAQPQRFETSTGKLDAMASFTTSPHCSVMLGCTKAPANAKKDGNSSYCLKRGICTNSPKPRAETWDLSASSSGPSPSKTRLHGRMPGSPVFESRTSVQYWA